ncbi:MAG: DUF1592 domain-containing protein [Verrucomicrobiota bacterium]
MRLFPLVVASLALQASPLTAREVPKDARVFLENYCFDCHDKATHKAGLNLESLRFDLDHKKTESFWVSCFDKLDHGQMPPKKADQPAPPESAKFRSWLGKELTAASLERQAKQGRTPVRRLTRFEYENTLRDLLHIETELKDFFPEDTLSDGFDKVAEGLSFSPVHFARYQEAADKALRDAVPEKPYAPLKASMDGKQIMKANPDTFSKFGSWMKDDAFVLTSNLFFPYTAVKTQKVPRTGRYRVTVTACGLYTDSRPFPLGFSLLRANSLPDAPEVVAWRDVPADEFGTVSVELTIVAGEQCVLTGWTLPHRDVVTGKQKKLKITPDQWTEPSLAIREIAIEGPLTDSGGPETYPPDSFKQIYGDLALRPISETQPGFSPDPKAKPPAKRNDAEWAADPLVPFAPDPNVAAEKLVRQFLPKAFRRPVPEELQNSYVDRIRASLTAGTPFHAAMRSVFKTILCSPHVVFLDEQPGKLEGYALATRLAYFLWNGPPDEALLAHAAQGDLAKAEVLNAEVERLLNHPKAARFERSFTAQWLDLNKINATAPDSSLYPEFDRILQDSALAETEHFFHEILAKNASLLEFVHSDWTFLNERLARHYNLPDVRGFELQRVSLPVDSHRGGVLTHASVLKVTADGAKTSPILRGKWICERILGITPPAPPEDVKKIEPDIRGANTIRVQLDKHRSSPACASCHVIMDPPGFALETFDVIGGWRTFYRTPDSKAPKVQLPQSKITVSKGLDVEEGYDTADGRHFGNVDEYKKLLLSEPDVLARNLATKLITYATGAPVQFADRPLVEQIVKDSRTHGFGLRTMVHQVVESRVFLEK